MAELNRVPAKAAELCPPAASRYTDRATKWKRPHFPAYGLDWRFTVNPNLLPNLILLN